MFKNKRSKRRVYTPEEDSLILEMINVYRLTYSDVGKELGRSGYSIGNRVSQLKLMGFHVNPARTSKHSLPLPADFWGTSLIKIGGKVPGHEQVQLTLDIECPPQTKKPSKREEKEKSTMYKYCGAFVIALFTSLVVYGTQ